MYGAWSGKYTKQNMGATRGYDHYHREHYQPGSAV